MRDIKTILMDRDSMSSQAADELIEDAKATLQVYLEEGQTDLAEDICQEFFGLEPDYIFELF